MIATKYRAQVWVWLAAWATITVFINGATPRSEWIYPGADGKLV